VTDVPTGLLGPVAAALLDAEIPATLGHAEGIARTALEAVPAGWARRQGEWADLSSRAAWDLLGTPANPQPLIWPECPTCETPWVWTRALDFMKGEYVWVWMRGCKHKSAAVLMTSAGAYVPPNVDRPGDSGG
jgi:hypothetical protein